MRAALLFDVRDLRLVDVPRPQAGPNGIVVRVTACAVCPTDIRKFRTGDEGELTFPFNMGHEWVGEIAEVGERVSGAELGTRVVGDGYSGYAEYAPLPDEMLCVDDGKPLTIPPTVTDEEATFVEPLADNIHAVIDQAKLSAGQTLLIIGGGQMALQQMLIARMLGATTIVSEPIDERRALAKRLGANYVIDTSSQDVASVVRELTAGAGADAAILSVGSPAGLLSALNSVRTKGRVVLFGGFERGTTVTVDPNVIHYRELEVVGSEWVGAAPYHNLALYRTALHMIERRQIPVADLITHRVALEDIHAAFEAMGKRNGLKAVVYMQGANYGKAASGEPKINF